MSSTKKKSNVYTRSSKNKRRLEKEDLWVQSNIDGEDEHIMIGKKDHTGDKSHLIVDGETGEIRIEKNRKNPREILQKIETTMITKDGRGIKSTRSTMEFTDETEVDENAPLLDVISEILHSGGPSGHFADFNVMNIGNKVAVDCSWGIKGFGYEWESSSNEKFMLVPQAHAILRYNLSEQDPFLQEIPELFVFFKYHDNKGIYYVTKRDLFQRKVPSGAFYEFVRGDFHSPTKLIDEEIISISEPYRVSQTLKTACDFEVKFGGETKIVTISLGPISIKAWELSTPKKVKSAITELGTKLIEKMIEENNLKDHFIDSSDFDLSKITKSGFEGYKIARDSL